MSLPPQSPLLAQRIRRGLTLAVRRRARLIFSGGVPAGTAVTEAGQMLEHARRCHAEELDALRHSPLLEEGSASTYENAVRTLALLWQAEPTTRDLYVVTNQFHQLRACATFRRAVNHSVSPQLRIRCVAMPPSRLQGRPSPERSAVPCGRSAAQPVDALELSWVLVREVVALGKYWAVGGYNYTALEDAQT